LIPTLGHWIPAIHVMHEFMNKIAQVLFRSLTSKIVCGWPTMTFVSSQ
jgi:hypothetical protein